MTEKSRLLERVVAARRKRVLDLPVPGVDGIVVRFGPLGSEELKAVADNARKRKLDAVTLNASFLVRACLAVLEEVDGRLVSVDPDDREGAYVDENGDLVTARVDVGADGRLRGPVLFDERLAELLGTERLATATVRALYVTDGDVVSTANAVIRHSGFVGDEIAQDALGN